LDMNSVRIFTAGSNNDLTRRVCELLGKPVGKSLVAKYPDGETKVEIVDNVRGNDCFVLQSTGPPVNDNLMQLLILIDALRRSSPKRITAVVPYFGYSRQDRKHAPREPITAKLVADLIEVAGPGRILFFDLHSDQIQGFFNIPVDNMLPDSLFIQWVQEKGLAPHNSVILAPDVGGARRARRVADHLGFKIALLESRNTPLGEPVESQVVGDLAENAIILDDMIDTGTRVVSAVNVLKKKGVQHIFVFASHAVFSGNTQMIQDSEVEEVTVTDTIQIPESKKFPKLKILSVAPLFAEAIRRIHNEEPLDQIFLG